MCVCVYIYIYILPGGAGGKEPGCQCRRLKRLAGQFLGQEDPLEKGMAIQFSVLFVHGESHGQRSLAGYSPQGCQEPDTTEEQHESTHIFTFNYICVLLLLLLSRFSHVRLCATP